MNSYNSYRITTKEDYQMYKYNDKSELLNITIPSGTILKTKWKTNNDETNVNSIAWYFVEYENNKGWIYIDPEKTKSEEEIIEEEKEETEEEDKKVEDKKELTPKQTAYIAIGVASLLAIGAAVTILLINKRKKVKALEPPVAEDTKENKTEAQEEKDNE